MPPHVCDLNLKYMLERKGRTFTTRFGFDGITVVDPNRADEKVAAVFQMIYDKAI